MSQDSSGGSDPQFDHPTNDPWANPFISDNPVTTQPVGNPEPEPPPSPRVARNDPPANPDPNPSTPASNQPGAGIPWNPGASQPSSAPPGYHWDASMANFVPNASSSTGGGFDAGSWVSQQLSSAQSTDDPNYWNQKIGADPNVQNPATRDSALAYWAQRIAQGNGALAVRNGSKSLFNDGGGAGGPAPGQGNGTGFADPAYQALNALAQARIASLQQPTSFPQLDSLMQQLQQQQAVNRQRAQQLAGQWGTRVTELQQPLLTQPQVVQQRALSENNLLASRDAALQNARASQSARGFAPTSGLAADQARQINENASNQQAQIEAQLQQGNIGTDEARRNEATQLQGLITQALNGGDASALQMQAQQADLENQQYQTNQQRATQALATAQIPVDLTNSGFANASGAISSPNSALASLMSLIGPAMTQQQNQFGQSNSQASGLSQIIQQLLQGLG